MKTIKTIILAAGAVALMAVASPAFAATESAPAAAPAAPTLQTYAFVDMTRVMKESTAAKSVTSELVKRKDEIVADAKKKKDSLVSEQRGLMKQQGSMSQEDFNTKVVKPWQEKANKAEESFDREQTSLEAVAHASMQKVQKLIGDTVEQVAQERKLAAVFSRDAVILGAKDLDITDEVIQRLNASGQKVAVDWSVKPAAKKEKQ